MKSLLLAVLAAVGLSGCYAEVAPYGAGYYGQPGYVTGGPVYTSAYGRPIYGSGYGSGYRSGYGSGYRPGAVYVSAPARGYHVAPAYRRAPSFAGHGGRRF